MWEKQSNDETAATFGTAFFHDELKPALTPPHTEKTDKRVNYILTTQFALCALLLLVAVAARWLGLPFYESLRESYVAALQQGVQFSGQEELVKFASAGIDAVQQQTESFMQDIQAQWQPEQETEQQTQQDTTQPLTGAGGQLAAKWPLVPVGNLLEQYTPPFDLAQPIQGYYITSEYGWRKHPTTKKSDFHTGIDLAVAEGTPVHAAAVGIVIKNEYNASYGNYITILHESGVATRYCHMQYVFVRQGEPITLDTVLGTVGQTGMATGPHLHFELLYDGIRYNPDEALGVA